MLGLMSYKQFAVIEASFQSMTKLYIEMKDNLMD